MQLVRWFAILFAAVVLMIDVSQVKAQERTLDEVKQEVLRRAPRINPFEGIKREDAEAIVKSLTSTDRDHWAEQWCKYGLKYEAEGDALALAVHANHIEGHQRRLAAALSRGGTTVAAASLAPNAAGVVRFPSVRACPCRDFRTGARRP